MVSGVQQENIRYTTLQDSFVFVLMETFPDWWMHSYVILMLFDQVGYVELM